MLGLDPGPYTFGELVTMFTERDKWQWDHTSAIVAASLSAFSKKPVDPNSVHPYRKGGGKRIPLTKENFHILKHLKGVKDATAES